MSIFKDNIPYHASGENIAYYSTSRQHYIIDNYISDNLPLSGWFKNCSNCGYVTGEYVEVKYRQRRVSIPICRFCEEKKREENNLYDFCSRVLYPIEFQRRRFSSTGNPMTTGSSSYRS